MEDAVEAGGRTGRARSSMPRVSASLGASWLFSSKAASAGDSVSELNAEITVEMAMVSANWR